MWEDMDVISSVIKRTSAYTIEIEWSNWTNGRKKVTQKFVELVTVMTMNREH